MKNIIGFSPTLALLFSFCTLVYADNDADDSADKPQAGGIIIPTQEQIEEYYETYNLRKRGGGLSSEPRGGRKIEKKS